MTDSFWILTILLTVAIFYIYVGWPRISYIEDIYFINLDSDVERRAHMEQQLVHAKQTVHRWSATNGANLTTNDMANNNVGEPVYSHRKNWDGTMRNAGVVGCWLSHVSLFRYLANKPIPDHAAHLILEDDVTVSPAALEPAVLENLPADWDIVYFGITKPNIESKVSDHIVKLQSHTLYGQGNFGTYGYAVRHGSLHTKILPFFTHFTNAIDVQLNQAFDRWNVYAIQPNVVSAESDHQAKSSIDKNV